MTNATTNVISTVPINCDDKNGKYRMDCYVLRTVLVLAILTLRAHTVF